MSNPSVGVVYLARHADGIAAFERFADSYRRHPAGIAHDLIVIYKGFAQQSDLKSARTTFDMPHLGIELEDVGFDIGAYLETSRRVSHDYLLFLNTHSEIAAPGWLASLFKYASQHGVGVAGVTGSYESLRQSWELIQMFYWLYYVKGFPYDENVARWYVKFLEYLPGSPSNPVLATKPTRDHASRALGAARYRFAQWQFQAHWRALLRPDNALGWVARYPRFPNPHLRSNGFMLRRDRLTHVYKPPIATKDDACLFESGPNSLTAHLRRSGLAAIVVGRNGEGYDVPDWWRSETFRLGNQQNLLLTDNHSRAYVTMSAEDQATHARMTWGDYLGPPPTECPTLGVLFRRGPLCPSPGRD